MRASKDTQELNVVLATADEILSVLPEGSVMRVCCDDRDALRYAVRASGLKLRQITLSRASLRRLVDDPLAAVKIDYLRRDIQRSAKRRESFQYPRQIRRATKRAKGGVSLRPWVLASVM
ncbi:MAG TPA: hypothetical protein VGR95_01495 [Thermoanaerobaculia bacterium]|nr:hypothetical protein [Thermoanaerobaculia bacterium]